jgi:hypothetical protein
VGIAHAIERVQFKWADETARFAVQNSFRYTFRQRPNFWNRWTRRFIMVKPTSDDSAFAKHFIESALKCLKSGEYAWALQSLANAVDAVKALKKKADGAE